MTRFYKTNIVTHRLLFKSIFHSVDKFGITKYICFNRLQDVEVNTRYVNT